MSADIAIDRVAVKCGTCGLDVIMSHRLIERMSPDADADVIMAALSKGWFQEYECAGCARVKSKGEPSCPGP